MSGSIHSSIIISAPPFSQIAGKEGVDLALVCAAFDQSVNLIFTDLGVFHLIAEQKAQFFTDKMHDKQLKGLEFYDIDNIFADRSSLQRFSIKQHQLIDSVSILDARDIQQMCDSSHYTVTF